MADAALNTPNNQADDQEFFTSDPEAAKTMETIQKERDVLESTLKTLSEGEVDDTTDTMTAAGTPQQLNPVEPISAEEKEIYRTTHTEAEGSYEERAAAGHTAIEEHRKEQKAILAKEGAKTTPINEIGEASEELSHLSKEKIESWLAKHQESIPQGLLDIFMLNETSKMSSDELALFTGNLKDPNAVESKTLFALSDWLNRIKRNGTELQIDESIGAAVILHQIQNDLPLTRPEA